MRATYGLHPLPPAPKLQICFSLWYGSLRSFYLHFGSPAVILVPVALWGQWWIFEGFGVLPGSLWGVILGPCSVFFVILLFGVKGGDWAAEVIWEGFGCRKPSQ